MATPPGLLSISTRLVLWVFLQVHVLAWFNLMIGMAGSRSLCTFCAFYTGQKVTSSSNFPPELARRELHRMCQLHRQGSTVQIFQEKILRTRSQLDFGPTAEETVIASVQFEMWYDPGLCQNACTLTSLEFTSQVLRASDVAADHEECSDALPGRPGRRHHQGHRFPLARLLLGWC